MLQLKNKEKNARSGDLGHVNYVIRIIILKWEMLEDSD